nr:energy transducer TonB [uncultured Capnocytophaga sp.]
MKVIITFIILFFVTSTSYSQVRCGEPIASDISNLDTIPYWIVEKKPIFKECENLTNNEQPLCFRQQLDKHITTHLRYPMEFCGQGRVLVSFCIGTDGFSKVLRVNSLGLPKVFEDEAKRIIESLPCLIAGQQNGKTVAVTFVYPIHF